MRCGRLSSCCVENLENQKKQNLTLTHIIWKRGAILMRVRICGPLPISQSFYMGLYI